MDASPDSDTQVDNVPGGEDHREDDFAADMDELFLEDDEQHDSTPEQDLPEIAIITCMVWCHLDQRDIPASIEAFARWSLNHHSRRYVLIQKSYLSFTNVGRFATHKTFMYLMYDVIQLRKSSLGCRLLVKRRDWESTMA